MVDVFHTFFGLAGLSLLDENTNEYELEPIDPTFALPKSTLYQKFAHVKPIIEDNYYKVKNT